MIIVADGLAQVGTAPPATRAHTRSQLPRSDSLVVKQKETTGGGWGSKARNARNRVATLVIG